jgi:hypothetical protein
MGKSVHYAENEKNLVEKGLRKACLDASKLLQKREFVNCEKFLELFLANVEIPNFNCLNCNALSYTEYDKTRSSYAVVIDILVQGYIYVYRCSFNVFVPRERYGDYHEQVTSSSIQLEEWELHKEIDYKEPTFWD